MFSGILCLLIDSTGFVVVGKLFYSSDVMALYALLNFFKTCGHLHHSVQVSTFFLLWVSTWSADIDAKLGGI